MNQSTLYLTSAHSKSTYNKATTSSRRSKKALTKVSKMKKAFSMARSETLTTEPDGGGPNQEDQPNDTFKLPEDLNDEFEDEVKNLYMWTKNLSLNDVDSI